MCLSVYQYVYPHLMSVSSYSPVMTLSALSCHGQLQLLSTPPLTLNMNITITLSQYLDPTDRQTTRQTDRQTDRETDR